MIVKSIFKQFVVWCLTHEAAVLLRRKRPVVVAVTGSVGKTATKDAVYTALRRFRPTRKSERSYNSELGVPLTVLGLQNAWQSPLGWLKNIIDGFFIAYFTRSYPEVLVLEMGVDRPGDMKALTKWITPSVVVLTRFPKVPVHVEFFASPDEVIREKMQLAAALPPDGILVFNGDDEAVRSRAEGVLQRTISYARYSEADVRATNDRVEYDAADTPRGVTFTLTVEGVSNEVSVLGGVGVQHAYACAAAMAVANAFALNTDAVAAQLRTFTPPPGRMRILEGVKDTVLLDDTYNASPIAGERALQTLKELKVKGRRIAVLGDMLELGQYSKQAHATLGEHAAGAADLLLTIGVRARQTAQTALAHGMREDSVLQFDDIHALGRALQRVMAPGDVVLFKASQRVRLEQAVKEVMAHPDDAPTILVRQSAAWQQH